MTRRLARTRAGLAALGVAAIAVVALAGTALAGHLTSGVKSYTGCLSSGDGSIVKVKEGDAPKSACSSSQTIVHLSGGDITKVSVSGGLTGGGENGEVTIGLDPKFSLPQNCTAPNNVAKWDGSTWACAADDNTTYSNGTGLDLAGTQFSIDEDYRVKNTPDCSAGQFATGFDSTGAVQCATPPAQDVPWLQGSGGGVVGDDGVFHAFASVTPAAGTYLVVAKGTITSEQNVDQFKNVQCRIANGGVQFDKVFLDDEHLNDSHATPFALTAIRAVTPGALALECRAGDGADGIALEDAQIVAIGIE